MSELFNFTEYPMIFILNEYWRVYGKKIKKEEIQYKLFTDLSEYISQAFDNDSEKKYLDYELKIDGKAECIEIMPNNMVTALWFMDIYPYDSILTNKKNECFTDEGLCIFNKKTRKIEWIREK
jgi:hypothetical protein